MDKEEKQRRGTSWRPFSELARWEEEVGRRFDDLLERRWSRLKGRSRGESGPPVDVYEENEEIVVLIEIPGMDKNDIELSLADRTLTVRGDKKKRPEVKEENDYQSEISYGPFTRVVELPHEVRPDRVRASFDKGVLEVRLPKSETARKSTKIDIG